MIGEVGARVSFDEGSKLLAELAGVQVNAKQVERMAEALGRQIAQDERNDVEGSDPALLPPTLYLGMDGTGLPMRPSEVNDRKGKQPDGSAKTREVKLCTVWSAEGRDEDKDIPIRDKGSVSYTAAIESASSMDTDKDLSEFAKRVEREALRRSFYNASRQVVLGDGAQWIWNIAGELFPDAIQIVDRFHAKKRLGDVSKEILGAGSESAQQWASIRCTELDDGDIDAIDSALAPYVDQFDVARKAIGYFRNNQDRMRYPTFKSAGLCTSTGVVEAGCRHAIGTRLKCSGMRWTVAGANDIIALRCSILSGRFEDFWERRTERIARA